GADGIDLGVDGADGDLGAMSGFACQGLEFDGAFADLRNFALEQAADELLVAAAEDYLDFAGGVADFEDERLDAFADFVRFAGDLLAAGHDALGAAEADLHGAAFEAGDGSGDDGSDAVLVFLVDAAAFI